MLYLHGGVFLTCGLNTHRSLVGRLTREAGAGVLNVGYRMLPTHGIADAVNDAFSGLRWLRRRGYRWSNIIVAGDSADGYLAFMATLAAVRAGLPGPAGIAAISPLTDAAAGPSAISAISSAKSPRSRRQPAGRAVPSAPAAPDLVRTGFLAVG